MSEQAEKNALKQRYVNQRKWRQATKSFGFWVYPKPYYDELIAIVLKHHKNT